MSFRIRLRGGVLAAVAASTVIATACSRPAPTPRVLVLGFDGMDPRAVALLSSEGKLPHFERLRREGAYAPLASAKPLLSPVVWTTVATGKTPDIHGITHFTAVDRASGQTLPVTSSMRRAKALWNIFSDRGRSVAVVGYWATWPAETVRGSIVSDHAGYHFLFREGIDGGAPRTGLTYPAALEADVRRFMKHAGDLGPADLAPFVHVPDADIRRPFTFDDDLAHFKWALATALSYRELGLSLWRRDRPDLAIVYFEATDSAAHLFGHLFRARGLAGELAEQQRRYGDAVEGVYELADRILGEFMAAMDERTTLVVLSDHGFMLGSLQDDPSKTRDMRRVSEAFHADHGVLYLYGRGVAAGRSLDQPSILDVAPTILSLAGLPTAKDMPGRVLVEGLTLAPTIAPVATYETGPTNARDAVADAGADEEIMEKLHALGYVGGSPGVEPSSAAERNMAAILFTQGRLEDSARAYQELVRREPEDGALRASLSGVLGALGRNAEAIAAADEAIRLQPINAEAHHNRALLLERSGRRPEAVAEYRTALRYQPGYEPSRNALARLHEEVVPSSAPRTAAEREAWSLCEKAAAAARRGDYAAASSALDAAERAAPRYALVQQYRANVAYLSGDKAGAIRALTRGLALEPDNALFRENLNRLRDTKPGGTLSPGH